MNLPNALTLIRIFLAFFVPAMVLADDFWLRVGSAVVFAVAAFTDWFDGWYARRHNLITKMGQILDPIADKILVLGSFVVLSDFTNIAMYSIWWIVPIFVRELVITIYRLIFLMQTRPVVVAAESWGKAKTVLQMLTLPFAYFFFMFKTYGGIEIAVLQYILYAMLLASLYFTTHSGIEFFVKNWQVIRNLGKADSKGA